MPLNELFVYKFQESRRNMALTDKLYAALSYDQRALASVAAIARIDDVELERLFATVPNRKYTAPDPRFLGSLRAIERLCLVTALEIQTQMVEWMRSLALSESGLRKGTQEALLEVEEERERSILARQILMATWHAYVDTCESIGLDPSETMCAFANVDAAVAGSVIGDTELDDELFSSAKKNMRMLIDYAW